MVVVKLRLCLGAKESVYLLRVYLLQVNLLSDGRLEDVHNKLD